MNIFDQVASHHPLAADRQEIPVTTPSAPAKPTVAQNVRADLVHVRGVLDDVARRSGRMLRVLEAIAMDPRVDALVDAALTAARLAVADEVFDAVTDSLRAAAGRKAASGTGGTGENPVAPEVTAHIAATETATPGPDARPQATPAADTADGTPADGGDAM